MDQVGPLLIALKRTSEGGHRVSDDTNARSDHGPGVCTASARRVGGALLVTDEGVRASWFAICLVTRRDVAGRSLSAWVGGSGGAVVQGEHFLRG
ncbi:hypothetical protein KCU71_g109, partial [Aureobasidium melanogenum]